MNETRVIIELISALNAFFSFTGDTVAVKQAYQEKFKTGPEQGAGLYLSIVGRKRYGQQRRRKSYNETTEKIDVESSFIRLVTFQVDAVKPKVDPGDFDELTAGDLADMAADGLNMDFIREQLKATGIGIDRITEVRPAYMLDENDQHESNPSFDVTLSYRKSYNTEVNVVTSSQANLQRV